MAHNIVWFDIPVIDFERAQRFYTAVLNAEVEEDHPQVGVFPHREGEVSGCIYLNEDDKPGENGPLLYLNVNGRLDEAIEQTRQHGGRVVKERHQIGPYGHRAIILDSEGNRIALHSE